MICKITLKVLNLFLLRLGLDNMNHMLKCDGFLIFYISKEV